MMAGLHPNIVIAENWSRSNWDNFTSYNAVTTGSVLGNSPNAPTYPFGLSTLNHLDIRTFDEPAGWTGAGFTPGYISTAGHFPGGTLALTTGTSTFTSNDTASLDLTALGPKAVVGLALPNFPAGQINLTNSYLELSSDGFGPSVCNLPWSTATNTTTSGYTSLVWANSQLTGIDLTHVTGVRLVIDATSNCTVYVMALRLLDPDWALTNVTYDNCSNVLRRTIPLDGNPGTSAPANQVLPTLWRSAQPSGVDDPQPIDASLGFFFNTGSQSGSNSFELNMRENGTAQTWISFVLQWGTTNQARIVGVEGTTTTVTIALSNQTTYWVLCSVSGTTAQLQIYNIDQHTLVPQAVIYDTTPVQNATAFVRRRGRLGFQANLIDGDTWISPWRPQSLMYAQYTSAAFQSMTPVAGAQLYVNSSADTQLWSGWAAYTTGAVNPVFTTDTTRTTTGASTRVQFLNNNANYPSSTQYPGPLLYPGGATQGVISNVLTPPGDPISGITDWSRLAISFDLWVPGGFSAEMLQGGVAAALIGVDVNTTIPLPIGLTTPNQWQHVRMDLPAHSPPLPSGRYQFVVYGFGTPGFTWWIDDVQITQPSVDWMARSNTSASWTRFGDLLNSSTDGIRLYPQGTQLELQALALRQDSFILDQIALVPKYAQLGNLLVGLTEDLYPGEIYPSPLLLPHEALV